MRSFGSDNNSGIHPDILQAIAEANKNHAVAYGDDVWTSEATLAIREAFDDRDVLPLFVFNGTGSNVVALDLLCKPYHCILAASTSHIYGDECGAPTRLTGSMIKAIPTPDGKLTVELLKPYLSDLGVVHHAQPKVIYLSQSTELGTVYTLNELRLIVEFAHQNGLLVHLDGARLANACVALGCSLSDMTSKIGIDTVSFGGTKNGMMMGECVLVFNKALQFEAPFVRKQAAQLASKMRYLSCQFTAYLKDSLWQRNAQQANRMAELLASELMTIGIQPFYAMQTNQLFYKLPANLVKALQEKYFFYIWNESESVVRFVTSFDTTEEDVLGLVECIKSLYKSEII